MMGGGYFRSEIIKALCFPSGLIQFLKDALPVAHP